MTDLRNHMLVWHKQCALVTGGISLTYGRNGIKKSEALDWIERLRNVADDIESVTSGGEFLLDGKGARIVKSDVGPKALDEKRGRADIDEADITAITVNGDHHVGSSKSEAQESASKAPVRKAGGLRVAKRKTNAK